MVTRILKENIKKPAADNENWIFPVKLDADPDDRTIGVEVSADKLQAWIKEAIARYPDSSGGDKEILADILANWNPIEGVLIEKLSSLAPF
jgi:hypothetical protein